MGEAGSLQKLKGGQNMNQSKRISKLFVGLLAVSLIVLATSVVASAGEPAEKTDAAFLAANPELMFARRYIAAETAERAAALANPMLYVRHYVVVSVSEPAEKMDATLLAANPELMFARRYAAAQATERTAAFSACYEGHH
jgi:hypothetical protein